MTGQEYSSDWNRLASAPTVLHALTGHVVDLKSVAAKELPTGMQKLQLPPGWQLAQIDSSSAQPARIAVCGSHTQEGWDGCETVSIFRFTGTPSTNLISEATEIMLDGLGVDASVTRPVAFGHHHPTSGVRSSGYLSVAKQRVWFQYSAYIAGSESPGRGILVEQGIFAAPYRQIDLQDDIAELTHAVYNLFVSLIETSPAEAENGTPKWPSLRKKGIKLSTLRVQPYDDVGVPSILVNADHQGMRTLQSAMRSAHETGEGTFELDGVQHRVVRQDDAADIELNTRTVTWRFDDARIVEILYMMEPLVDEDGAGHQYIDSINSPVETVILSVDEYVGTAPYGEFPQLAPHPPEAE